jgi:hypothetical protein
VSDFAKLSNEISFCLRDSVCKCVDSSKCLCDSDAFVSIASSQFSAHSNCRYTIELSLKQRVDCRRWPSEKIIRVFALANDAHLTEYPILDVASTVWKWCGENTKTKAVKQMKPTMSTATSPTTATATGIDYKKPTIIPKTLGDISFGTCRVFAPPNPKSFLPSSYTYDLTDHVFVSDRSILISFDYMSFHY